MTVPISAEAFDPRTPLLRARAHDGLPPALDAAAEGARPSHRFLRRAWFAAALDAYGGCARTMVVDRDGVPLAALPLTTIGPRWLRAASVPGCYWPFRSFPSEAAAGADVFASLASGLAREVNALRIGPVYDDDASAMPLIDAARASGWAVLDRKIADSHVLDMDAAGAEGPWPRNSTLRKNRFHEKHLAAHGTLDWSFVHGDNWTPAAFDALAGIEQASWIANRTDGSDAKFTAAGHGAFWRAAAADPVIARMMWAALLRVDGRPAAFSFDINAGALKYAIANSYDPAFAKHSPGKLLYYRNLVRAREDGIACVDWGAGDSEYKATIGAEPGPAIRDWLLLRPGLPAFAGRLLGTAWRRSGQG